MSVFFRWPCVIVFLMATKAPTFHRYIADQASIYGNDTAVIQVSGLVTTAGINVVLIVIFLGIFSVLRSQSGNAKVYFAHLILNRRREGCTADQFSIYSLLTSENWVKAAWRPSQEEILQSSGMDAVVFMRVFVFCIRFFTVATVIGMFFLLPLNYITSDFGIDQISDISHDALSKFTISNIVSGSNRLWGHLCALYIISIVAYYLLYLENRDINEMRLQYLRNARPQPEQFTILVRAIPTSKTCTYSEEVKEFFSKFHPHTYLLHNNVYRTGKLEKMMREAGRLYREVEALRENTGEVIRPSKVAILGLFGKKIDTDGEDLEHGIQDLQSEVSYIGKELPCAFVSFKTRCGALSAAQAQQSTNPMEWVTEWAPEPRDVDWSSLSISYSQLWSRRLFATFCAFFITVLYAIPMSATQALVQVDVLQRWFPLVRAIVLIPGVSSLISSYLPSLVITILLYIGPTIMLMLTRMEGYVSKSSQEIKACGKSYNFLIGNVFFLVTTGSLISLLDQYFTEPKKIPIRLATALSQQANVFMSLIFTKGWTGLGVEILQLDVFLEVFFLKHFLSRQTERPCEQSLKYYRALPNLQLFMFIGFMYAILAPLLLPFLLIYFIVGYIVFRSEILNVYEPAYETAGQYWPLVHNRAMVAIFLMQLSCLGMFAAKKKAVVSALGVPILIMTLLFHYYCHIRFHPNFRTTSIEVVVTKDMDDEHNGVEDEFICTLEKAYLSPSQKLARIDGDTPDYLNPLLSFEDQSSA